MPSQAETIAALQGLSPVTTPQSPADPYAAAMTFGSAIGLPDAIKALKGQMTPEEAQNFALTSAMGLLPGGKAETAAVKTMGELLPHMYPAGSTFAKLSPKEYLGMFGSDLPKQLPQDVENVLKPYMQPAPKVGKVPGPGPVQQFTPKEKTFGELYPNDYLSDNPVSKLTHSDIQAGMDSQNPAFLKFLKNNPSVSSQNISKSPAQLAKEAGQIYPPIDETAISNALAKNPGASIFDVANTHVGGPSSSISKSGWGGTAEVFHGLDAEIPREGGVLATPLAAKILGRSENLLHGTRVGPEQWQTPSGSGASLGGVLDALKLPDDELGVHFGNPRQANVFSGDYLTNNRDAPRQYPVVVAANNPLRLPDSGTWHAEDIIRSLGKATATNPVTGNNLPMFPPEELKGLSSIEDVRNYIAGKGYDSVVYKNKSEDAGHDSFIKFMPSPEAPDFVSGVRSPFAAFDPSKIMRPELAAGLAGGTLATPAIDPNLLKALTGSQTDQQQ